MGEIEARARLSAEIERLATNAVRSGFVVRTDYYAGNAYAEAGSSLDQVVDAIAEAAGRRRAPGEIVHPGWRPPLGTADSLAV